MQHTLTLECMGQSTNSPAFKIMTMEYLNIQNANNDQKPVEFRALLNLN